MIITKHMDPYLKKSNETLQETKTVRLTQGKVAVVDEADFDWVMRWKWCAVRIGLRWYAVRVGPRPERKRIYMHRILTFAERGEEVDHISGDGLDNRQSNLRRCTSQENKRGFRRKTAGLTSRFRGVSWCARRKKWRAEICVREGVSRHIGYFEDEETAGRARASAALLHFGAFAPANIFSQELL